MENATVMAMPYHFTASGVSFISDRTDLKNGVTVRVSPNTADAVLLQAQAAFINHHRGSMAVWVDTQVAPIAYQHVKYEVIRG
jgi:hypothetical protein